MTRWVGKVNLVNVAKEKYSSCNVERMIIEIASLKITLQSSNSFFFSFYVIESFINYA